MNAASLLIAGLVGIMASAAPANDKPLPDYLEALRTAARPDNFESKLDSLAWERRVRELSAFERAVTAFGDTAVADLGWLSVDVGAGGMGQGLEGAIVAGKAHSHAPLDSLAAARERAAAEIDGMLRDGSFTPERPEPGGTLADLLAGWWERFAGEDSDSEPAEAPDPDTVRWTRNLQTVLLILLVLALFWPTIRDIRLRLRKRRVAEELDAQAEVLSLAELRSRADSALQDGDPREAVRFYMAWLLASLSDQGRAPSRSGATVREQIAGVPGATPLMAVYEPVVYGGIAIDRRDAEAFGRSAEELAERREASP